MVYVIVTGAPEVKRTNVYGIPTHDFIKITSLDNTVHLREDEEEFMHFGRCHCDLLPVDFINAMELHLNYSIAASGNKGHNTGEFLWTLTRPDNEEDIDERNRMEVEGEERRRPPPTFRGTRAEQQERLREMTEETEKVLAQSPRRKKPASKQLQPQPRQQEREQKEQQEQERKEQQEREEKQKERDQKREQKLKEWEEKHKEQKK